MSDLEEHMQTTLPTLAKFELCIGPTSLRPHLNQYRTSGFRCMSMSKCSEFGILQGRVWSGRRALEASFLDPCPNDTKLHVVQEV